MASKFEFICDEEGNRSECECCGFPAPLASFRTGATEDRTMLCDVCSSTYLSYAVTAPRICEDPLLSKSIGYVANEILSEIRELKEQLKGGLSGQDKKHDWPSENKQPIIEICWIGPSGDSFISGCIGNCCGLDDIEKDVLRDPESIEELFKDGFGQYLFSVDWIEPQVNEIGRVEIAGEWMLTRIAFKKFDS